MSEKKLPKTFDDREIRSFEEKVLAPEFQEKNFVVKTFGACESNNKPMILRANCDRNMWLHGVGMIKIGDETAFFDINELINYLRVCVE